MESDAFIEKYHHLIAGMILDGATTLRDGHALSLWLKQVMPRVDNMLRQAYGDVINKPKPAQQQPGPKLAKAT